MCTVKANSADSLAFPNANSWPFLTQCSVQLSVTPTARCKLNYYMLKKSLCQKRYKRWQAVIRKGSHGLIDGSLGCLSLQQFDSKTMSSYYKYPER